MKQGFQDPSHPCQIHLVAHQLPLETVSEPSLVLGTTALPELPRLIDYLDVFREVRHDLVHGRAATTRIKIDRLQHQSALAQLPSASSSRFFLKKPTWVGLHKSKTVKGANVMTVLEVAWALGSLQDLERASAPWTSSQRNEIVFQTWWKGREGRKAALSEQLLGRGENIAQWLKDALNLFNIQGAQDSFRRPQRLGQPPEIVRLRVSDQRVEMGTYCMIPIWALSILPLLRRVGIQDLHRRRALPLNTCSESTKYRLTLPSRR
ncbi:hypothetical protein BCV69DRAFT_777 [Microstroma glucosiphilum]|uniref:Uncharacterized protein n=1 Tax=Pseudomicrostroma glucosiphilum TaxID=1684307 RepID=A0A316UE18_9BASI|nr:hypothetical protein BCV69DRAFT_777 [Pseudomicrostroma glucosiphilum]PWN23507.1 hypothetical protein BCV69DRAFT_777 [Pseudomicrostroma glucosiphilum]